MSTSPSSEKLTLHIDEVKPYWRNPRKIPEEAVTAVGESLSTFGYVQPIVVDSENVIIIGHTRYTAMRRLGVTHVDVLRSSLPPAKVKQLRVIDNRVHENAWWDRDVLLEELASLPDDNDLILTLFPEATAPVDPGPTVDVEKEWTPDAPQTTEFICPACYHEWKTVVTLEHVLSGHITNDEEAKA